MLAILNNYRDKKERLVDKPHIAQYNKKQKTKNNHKSGSNIHIELK